MNVVVCVKQIPDPAVPGELDPETKRSSVRASSSSTSPTATASRWRSSSSTTAGGGEVTLVSMAPNDEVSGLRTALAMGAAKAILVSDDAAGRRRRAVGTAKVLAKSRRAGRRRRPRPHRHRVDRRLHRHDPGAGRRAARLAVAHVRQAHRDRRRQGEDPAPDRGGLRRRRGVAARGRERDRRCRRAPLPVVQGDHGGEEQAGRPGDGRPTSASATTRSAGPAPARRSPTSRPRPSARPARRSRTTATAHEQIVAFLEQLKVI